MIRWDHGSPNVDFSPKLVLQWVECLPLEVSGGKGKGKRGDKGKGGPKWRSFSLTENWEIGEISSFLCGVLVKFKFSLLDLNFLVGSNTYLDGYSVPLLFRNMD